MRPIELLFSTAKKIPKICQKQEDSLAFLTNRYTKKELLLINCDPLFFWKNSHKLCSKILVTAIWIISVILRWTVYGKKCSVCTQRYILFSRIWPLHCTLAQKEADIGPRRQSRRMAADLHDGGGWDRLALVGGEQACHTPCPCHASQPHSSHTDANQGRLPRKEVPGKCQRTSEKEAACRVSHIGHKNLPHSCQDWWWDGSLCQNVLLCNLPCLSSWPASQSGYENGNLLFVCLSIIVTHHCNKSCWSQRPCQMD